MIREEWCSRSGAQFPNRPFVWRDVIEKQTDWAHKTGRRGQLTTGVVGTADELDALLARMDADWTVDAS